MITHKNGVWIVPLADHHQFYRFVELKRDLPNHPDYTVVIVNTKKFIECFENGSPTFLVPPVVAWTTRKRNGLRTFLDPATGPPNMPRAHIQIALQPRLFGIRKPLEVAIVSFTNGRHRTRYLDDAGAICIPIEVHLSMVRLFSTYCSRRCSP